jgi:hypothetical protein
VAGTGTLRARGSYAAATSTISSVEVAATEQGAASTISRAFVATTIVEAPLAVTQTAQTAQQGTAASGEEITYRVTVSNKSPAPLSNVIASVMLQGASYDLSSIKSSGAAVSGNIITWSSGGVPDFKNLAPGASVVLEVKVSVKKVLTAEEQKSKLSSKPQASATGIEGAIVGEVSELSVIQPISGQVP